MKKALLAVGVVVVIAVVVIVVFRIRYLGSCQYRADLARGIAEARDKGVPEAEELEFLKRKASSTVEQEMWEQLVPNVYSSPLDGDHVAEQVMTGCMSNPANR
jgi:hypothetical protein